MFVSLQFKLELKKEDREKLIKLMRKQSFAILTAYNMLRELEKEKTKKPTRSNTPKTEVKDSLKSFARITLQENREKDLENSRENEDKEHL